MPGIPRAPALSSLQAKQLAIQQAQLAQAQAMGLYPYASNQAYQGYQPYLSQTPYTDYNVQDIVLSTTSGYQTYPLDDYLADSPYVSSIGYDMYGTPVLGIYKNLNADPYIRSRMIDLYYHKTAEKWLEGDLLEVLNYFKIHDGKAHLLKTLDQYSPVTADKDSSGDRDKKIALIKDLVLTKDFVKKVLKRYVNDSGQNWYDLTLIANDYNIRGTMKDALIKEIKGLIKRKNE